MLVKEFLEQVGNPCLSPDANPGYYMVLFLTMLNEFRDDKCSVLLGKIKAGMSPDLKQDVNVSLADYKVPPIDSI